MKRMTQLDQNWQLAGFAPETFSPTMMQSGARPDIDWMDASVPCDVHTQLMRAGRIEDPAVGANDVSTRWVEKQIWVYRTVFSVTAKDLSAAILELVFQGLDTYADVYVNDVFAAHFENMFTEHRVDLHACAKEGENRLSVIFYPFSECSTRKALPDGFWTNYSTERAYARKAAYQVGWDWTPRVCTVGIWRPVALCTAPVCSLDGLQMQTVALDPQHDRATLRLSAQYRPADGRDLHLRFSLWQEDGTQCAAAETSQESTLLTVEKPHLWWTQDQGKPYLYTLRGELVDAAGHVHDAVSRKVGIRTIELKYEDPQTKEARFQMVLNGRPIFARGANWVPASNRPAALTEEDYTALLCRVRDANMNTISLWGGGIYEADCFYDFCDANGLLVWQYFMFACGEYPDFDEAFVGNVEEEVAHVVRRLTGHPCIALWIGNVECTMLCEKIGLERPMYGRALFDEKIPAWLHALDPDAVYIPSSPWGQGLANEMQTGDRHNWNVWFDDVPYTEYCRDTTLFASEFGLHGAPSMQVYRMATGQDEPQLESFAVQYINRDQSLDRMTYYLDAYTGHPKTLRDHIVQTDLIQMMALACACGHYRHRFPACAGALVWQLNDCCYAHSWSLVDYCGIPKAAWYAVRQAFAPVSVYLEECADDVTRIWAMNNGSQDVDALLSLEVGNFLGERSLTETLPVRLPAGTSQCVRTVRAGGRFYPNAILMNRTRLYYLAVTVDGMQRPFVRFYEKPKDLLLPPLQLDVTWQEDRVTVCAKVFAQFVHLEGELDGFEIEDNYFDLLPGTKRTLRFSDRKGKGPQHRRLRWAARNPEEVPV